jgi:hypothetical protein
MAMSAAVLLAVLILPACSERDDGPEVPAAVQVPAGNALKVRYHAVGMQVYTWSATEAHWGPPKPLATLFLGDVLAATHSEGPIWQNTDGSKVVGAMVASATVGDAAIPWLLLRAASRSGPGLFADVTFVQRINTKGGLPPAGSGSTDGAQIQVHYEADYLFYHAQ